ncbi:MAG: hypothetical protein L0206_12745 [Actinobacteria bacterium]|nr:hypothetical protein [Actinomycetota bacterium]
MTVRKEVDGDGRAQTVRKGVRAGLGGDGWSVARDRSAGAQQEPIRVDVPAVGGVLLDLDDDGRIDTGDRITGRIRMEDPGHR